MIYENIYYNKFYDTFMDLMETHIENKGYFVFDENYLKNYFDKLIYLEKKQCYEKATGISYEKYLNSEFDSLDELLNSAYKDKVLEFDFSYMFEPIINLLSKYALENYNNILLNNRRIYYLEIDKIEEF